MCNLLEHDVLEKFSEVRPVSFAVRCKIAAPDGSDGKVKRRHDGGLWALAGCHERIQPSC